MSKQVSTVTGVGRRQAMGVQRSQGVKNPGRRCSGLGCVGAVRNRGHGHILLVL